MVFSALILGLCHNNRTIRFPPPFANSQDNRSRGKRPDMFWEVSGTSKGSWEGFGNGPKHPRHQMITCNYFRFCELILGSCGPGKLNEKGKLPKALRGGCKRSFGPREQRSPKSLLHHPKLLLHRWQKQFWVVQKTFRRPLLPGSKRPFAPSPKRFWEFSLCIQFPRPAASQN